MSDRVETEEVQICARDGWKLAGATLVFFVPLASRCGLMCGLVPPLVEKVGRGWKFVNWITTHTRYVHNVCVGFFDAELEIL